MNWAVKVVIQVVLFVLIMLRKTYEQKQLGHKLTVRLTTCWTICKLKAVVGSWMHKSSSIILLYIICYTMFTSKSCVMRTSELETKAVVQVTVFVLII